MHYYKDPHPYFDMDVLVIGAKNSASIAALELWRRGSRVTMVHRGPDIHRNVKYWIKPDIENRIKNGEVRAYFNSCVLGIKPEEVRIKTPEGERVLKNDFVFALTGYHPDYEFLESVGIELTRPEMRPVCDPLTFESNVPGIYVAGVVVSGARTSEIFIENGRFHGKQIADDLKTKLHVARVK
jgi:thioredoxin reductase (NADPH)